MMENDPMLNTQYLEGFTDKCKCGKPKDIDHTICGDCFSGSINGKYSQGHVSRRRSLTRMIDSLDLITLEYKDELRQINNWLAEVKRSKKLIKECDDWFKKRKNPIKKKRRR